MRKPPCQKCNASHVYLETSGRDEVYLCCYVCGWRIYGEIQIRAYVLQYSSSLEKTEELQKEKEAGRASEEAERLRTEKEESKKAEMKRKKAARDRRYRDKKRATLHLVPATVPGFSYQEGDLDPVLQLRWAGPRKPGALPSCEWPPCTERSREKSRYCSRKCGVRVAHRRARLRKAGLLSAKKAS